MGKFANNVPALKCRRTNGKLALLLLILFTQFNSNAQSFIESDSFPKKISELILSTKKKNIGVSCFVNDDDQATKFGRYICDNLVAGLFKLTNNNTLYKVKELPLIYNNDYCNSLKDPNIDLIIVGKINIIGNKYRIIIRLIDKTDCTTREYCTISDIDASSYSNYHSTLIPYPYMYNGVSNQNYNPNNLPPPPIPGPKYEYGPIAPGVGSGYGYPNTVPQYPNQNKQKPIRVF